MINAMYPLNTLFYSFPECLNFCHQPGEPNGASVGRQSGGYVRHIPLLEAKWKKPICWRARSVRGECASEADPWKIDDLGAEMLIQKLRKMHKWGGGKKMAPTMLSCLNCCAAKGL